MHQHHQPGSSTPVAMAPVLIGFAAMFVLSFRAASTFAGRPDFCTAGPSPEPPPSWARLGATTQAGTLPSSGATRGSWSAARPLPRPRTSRSPRSRGRCRMRSPSRHLPGCPCGHDRPLLGCRATRSVILGVLSQVGLHLGHRVVSGSRRSARSGSSASSSGAGSSSGSGVVSGWVRTSRSTTSIGVVPCGIPAAPAPGSAARAPRPWAGCAVCQCRMWVLSAMSSTHRDHVPGPDEDLDVAGLLLREVVADLVVLPARGEVLRPRRRRSCRSSAAG